MKIKAVVIFNDHERSFHIPCGAGDKTFKWLGIVASQRYSTAIPNGALRRRDDFCGNSERAQYSTANIILPSGDLPHPAELINEYLRDGDEVRIVLCDKFEVDYVSGCPNPSKWVTLAYSISSMNLNPEAEAEETKGSPGEEEDEEENGESEEAKDDRIKSKSRFMKIVLHSQMLDIKKSIAQMKSAWARISDKIPLLKMDEIPLIKDTLTDYWDALADLFQNYAPDGRMRKAEFLAFIDDAEVFHVVDSEAMANKIYQRTCRYVGIEESDFDLSAMLVALLLCAQTKYNDTLVHVTSSGHRSCHDAVQEILTINFVPLARKLQLPSILMYDFCSDECLSRIRDLYEQLQAIFDKYAEKYRDFPSCLPIDDIQHVLIRGNLVNETDSEKMAKALNSTIRKGNIFGRPNPVERVDEYTLVSYEVSFAEFIHIIAMAGFYVFFTKTAEENDKMTIADAYVKGLVAVIEDTHAKVLAAKAHKHAGKPTGGKK